MAKAKRPSAGSAKGASTRYNAGGTSGKGLPMKSKRSKSVKKG